MRDFQGALASDRVNVDRALPTFAIHGDKQIPWLPYYHPAARELASKLGKQQYVDDFSALAKALLKRGRN